MLGLPHIVRVGRQEGSDATEPSSITPEGIAAKDGLILTANEGESSVSLIAP